MLVEDIRAVVDVWEQQSIELGGRKDFSYVQVFETRGAMMGAGNPYPHGQIWTSRSIPNEVMTELRGQQTYFKEKHEV